MGLSDEEIRDFLGQANVAVLATVRADGRPHVVPTWYEYDEGEIVLHMSPEAVRYRNLQGNPNVALCFDTKTPPYKAVIVEGVAETREGEDNDGTLRMGIHYLGEPVGRRYAESLKGSKMVIARVKPQRIVSWDYGKGDNP